MRATEAFRRLSALGVSVLRTADAASSLGLRIDAASQLLRRLRDDGLVSSLRKGLWCIGKPPDRMALVEHLTAPHPAYVSLQSALYARGMIDQIPETIYVVSLGRPGSIKTSAGVFSVHHVPPELFGGFEYLPESGIKLAFPEKALVDLLYLSGTSLRLFRSLPELELPRGFRASEARDWIRRIPSPRLRSLVESRFKQVLSAASPAPGKRSKAGDRVANELSRDRKGAGRPSLHRQSVRRRP
jgi:DNA-binding transcriptional ArsR family regulator